MNPVSITNPVSIFTPNPWGKFKETADDRKILHTPKINENLIVEWDEQQKCWVFKRELFIATLRERAEQFPMGTDDYPRIIFIMEDWYRHDVNRLHIMQEAAIIGTRFFDDRVEVGFKGIPKHRPMWDPQSKPDYSLQPVINISGFVPLTAYSRGVGKDYIKKDLVAIDRLLKHTISVAGNRPIVVTLSGRRGYAQGWGEVGHDNFLKMCYVAKHYGCGIILFGGKSFLGATLIMAKAGVIPVDPNDVPDERQYAIEQAGYLRVAHDVMLN